VRSMIGKLLRCAILPSRLKLAGCGAEPRTARQDRALALTHPLLTFALPEPRVPAFARGPCGAWRASVASRADGNMALFLGSRSLVRLLDIRAIPSLECVVGDVCYCGSQNAQNRLPLSFAISIDPCLTHACSSVSPRMNQPTPNPVPAIANTPTTRYTSSVRSL
jgi:hypothetical protein